MTAKIFRSTLLLGVLIFAVCVAVFMGILYGYFEDRVYSELSGEAAFVARGVESAGADYFAGLETENRVTWIRGDGTVLYDSVGDAAAMGNHLDRQEVRQALANGSGRSEHYSHVFLEKTLYYALKAGDGTVVRVACVQKTVGTLLMGMITPISWILVLTLLLSALLAGRLAKKITGPINKLDLDDPRLSPELKELEPLVLRLREQNSTIRAQIEQLQRKQKEFSTITENMSEGFILVDSQANMLSHNSSALKVLSAGEAQGSGSVYLLNKEPRFAAAVDNALAGRHGEALLAVDGRSCQVMANPVISSGQVTGAVLVIMDVTEREQRDALRREFTANVSHELKTPLTSISGFAELIKDGLAPADKAREFAGDIYSESRRLIALVEDIIKLSRLDEESFAPEKKSVDLYDLSRRVIDRLAPESEKKNVTVTLKGEHITVSGVEQILDEMVYNLIDNAIKYNKESGSVTVETLSVGSDVRWSVKDTGIGIPRESQPRVFERFYRVDKSHSKDVGGTGLGLSIVKHGAIYHNARVELESEPGKGTEITVVF